MRHVQPSETPATLRADARRNQARVLEGARLAFAESGFDASYHEVARLAGVGVGTVYRRFPDRDALFEALLIDILDELTAKAEAATVDSDRWALFRRFFHDLAAYMGRHAGLSGQLKGRSPRVTTARNRLVDAVDALCQRTHAAGLRDDVSWRDILFLAQATTANGCDLLVEADVGRGRRAADVILDGLRADRAAN